MLTWLEGHVLDLGSWLLDSEHGSALHCHSPGPKNGPVQGRIREENYSVGHSFATKGRVRLEL